MGANRYAALNPSFATDLAEWSTSTGTLARIASEGHDAGAGFARFTSNGTGNRNVLHTPIACAPGEVFSADAWVKWEAGAVIRGMAIMCQWLDGAGVQVGTVSIGSTVTPNASTWSRVVVENAVAPAGTSQMRVQIRMLAAAVNDAVNIDDVWLNNGATSDRTLPPAPGTTYFVLQGGVEVPVVSFATMAAGAAVPVTL